MRPSWFIVLLSTLLMFSADGSARSALAHPQVQNGTRVPRFEEARCVVDVPETEKDKVRCGFLVVRENRARKNSRTIRLPIIILKSSSQNPEPDPVLRTLGGPGASSLRMIRGRRFSPWLRNRDLVIFEQRGTRYAEPNLDCFEVGAVRVENVKKNVTGEAAVRREVEAAKTCYDRLIKSGADLTGYDSVQSAADIEDLRRVLGYEQWNLYGVSYSARLMLNVMRDHPQGIRSVVLESVLPPSVNYDEVGVDGAVRSLDLFFANCAAEATCSKAYPKLEDSFYELVRRANREPIELKLKGAGADEKFSIRINGDDIVTWLLDYVLSADREAILAGPTQIRRLLDGDFSPFNNYAQDKLSPGGSMLGMRFSFWCREEMPFESPQKIAAQARRYRNLMGYEIQPGLLATCKVWKVGRAKPRENQTVRSNIPTLVLGAEYDAYTPPAWGQLVSKNLKHSYFYEVPQVGHGPGFSSVCARQIIAEFLNNPHSAPGTGCLSQRQKFVVPTVTQ
jgi:pimeloyl-ACP methyl ester carboxylesterase